MSGAVTLAFPMLPWQSEARKLKQTPGVKYNVWNCGVGCGKTVFGCANIVEDFHGQIGGFAWWVCPEDFQIQRFAGDFGPRARRLGWKYREHPYVKATNKHGAELHGITAKNLNKIAAYHPKILYVDEAAKLSKVQWDLIRIRAVHARLVVYMSTPRPNHWKKVVQDGRRRRDGKWAAVEVSTPEAGLVSAATIEELRQDLPTDLFRQEILAKFVKDQGSVFRRVEAAAHFDPEEPGEGEPADLVTQDVAKHEDFGFITVWRGYRILKCVRLQHAAYRAQAIRAVQICKDYDAPLLFDQTGVGESYGEMAEDEGAKAGVQVEGFVFTGQNKPVLVQAAVKAFEDRLFELIDPKHGEPYDVLVEEALGYSMKRSGSGLSYSYSAPEGEHDDSVTTLLLRVSVDQLADGVAGYYADLRKERGATGGEAPQIEAKDEAEE